MANKVGKVVFEIGADGKLASNEISRLSAQSEKGFNFIQGVATGAFTALSQAGMQALQKVEQYIASTVDEASRAEEIGSKYAVVFKGVEEQAAAMVTQLRGAFELSEASAQEFMSTFQDILVPLGMSRDSAAELSGSFTKLAIDLGSFNDVGTEQVIGDIQSAIVGNYETMKKYGVILNDTIMKEEARSRGLINAAGDIDQAGRAQIAYDLIVRSSADAMGDFARTQDSYANQQKILKENFRQLSVEIGQRLMPIMGSFVENINNAFENNTNLIDTTQKLKDVQEEYKKVIDQLAASQGTLNTEERNNLLLREQQLAMERNQLLARAINEANEMEQQAFIDRLTGRSGTRLDELKKKIFALEEVIRSYNIRANAGVRLTDTQVNAWTEQAAELEKLKNEYSDYMTMMTRSALIYAELYKNENISMEQVRSLPGLLGEMTNEAIDNLENFKFEYYKYLDEFVQARNVPTPTTTTGGTVGTTDQTTQYISEWDTVNILLENHQIGLAEAANRLSAIVWSERERKNELLAIAASEKRLTEDQKKELDQLNQHINVYGEIRDRLQQTVYFKEIGSSHDQKTAKELEKQIDLISTITTAVGQIADAYKAVTGAENEASQKLEELANTAITLGENLAKAIASGGEDVEADIAAVTGLITLVGELVTGWTSADTALEDNVANAEKYLSRIEAIFNAINTLSQLGVDTDLQGYKDALAQAVQAYNEGFAGMDFGLNPDGTIADPELVAQALQSYQGIVAASDAISTSLQTDIDASAPLDKGARMRANQEAVQQMYDAGLLSLQSYNDLMGQATDDWADQYGLADDLQAILEKEGAYYQAQVDSLNTIIGQSETLANLLDDMGLTPESQLAVYQAQRAWLDTVLDSYTEGTEEYENAQAQIEENIDNQIAALEDQLAGTESIIEKYNIMADIQSLQNELQAEKNKLLEDQLNLLDNSADYLDMMNRANAQMVESQYRTLGLAGANLNERLSSLGVTGRGTGDTITTRNVGTVVNYKTVIKGDDDLNIDK